jgi:hypothetical protein
MKFPLFGLLLSFFVATTFPSQASDVTVGVGYFSLSPNPVYIKTGDTVYWDDADEDFAPYIITGNWGSFYTPGGVQFIGAGTYSYTARSSFGGGSYGGTVYVSANALPTVTITSPTNNAVFSVPATFAFAATATDADANDIWDVEFWVGNTMVDDVYSAPYTTTVTNLAAGTYTLKAIVWDYSSAKATNTITITVVTPGPITLTGSALANGNLVFKANGLGVGKTNVLQYSTNLTGWSALSTNVASSSTAMFTNTATGTLRFFRLVQSP